MKKLLILMLILGLASAAHAATMSFDGGTNITWSGTRWEIQQNTTGTVLLEADVAATSFELQADLAGAGFVSGAVGTVNATFTSQGAGTITGGSLRDVYGSGTGSVAAGTALYDFTILSGGTVDDVITIVTATGGIPPKYTQLNSVDVTDSMTITIVPEPMTIALLGLGGLFLRRRK